MYLATDLERGGLPLRLVALASRLAAEGVTPVVGSLAGRGPLHGVLEQRGIQTFACGGRGGRDVMCLARFARTVARVDPHLIHASLFHANLAARLMGRIDRGRPVITSSVTIEVERPWHRRLEALTCGLSDVHVANSEAVATHLRDDLGFPPRLVRTIANGIDVERFGAASAQERGELDALGIRRDSPLVVWVGRMDPVKRLDVFVDVVAELRATGDIQAALVGDGPDRARIESLVARKGLTSVVRFAGWSAHVPAWLAAADLLLFPSRTEGCPNAVLEGLAAGRPVVASDIAPHAEIIRDGVTGRLCPPEDTAAYVRGVRSVLEGRGWYDAVAARETVRARYGLGAAAAAWKTLYQEVLM